MAAKWNVYAPDEANATGWRSEPSSGYAVKVLIFSDIHGDLRALERIVSQPADVYIDAGDLATFSRGLERCAEVLKPLGERLWVLPGNHETHDATRAFCEKFGFLDFHRQIRTLNQAPDRFCGRALATATSRRSIHRANIPKKRSPPCAGGIRRDQAATPRGSFPAIRDETG